MTEEVAKNLDVTSLCDPNELGVCGSREEGLSCSTIKEEDARNETFKDKTTTALSLATPGSIITDIPVPGQSFPYVIPASNAVPYFFDPQTATTVIHVAPPPPHQTASESLHINGSDKRSQGTSPVPCPDICLTPPSDATGRHTSDEGELESENEKTIGTNMQEDGEDGTTIKMEPLMADACNQTETPPMTDDDEDDEDGDDTSNDEDDNDSLSSGRSPDGKLDRASNNPVKVEDISVQCELLDELLDIQNSMADSKPSISIDVHGLELLSNIIEERRQDPYNCNTSTTLSSTEKETKSLPITNENKEGLCIFLDKTKQVRLQESQQNIEKVQETSVKLNPTRPINVETMCSADFTDKTTSNSPVNDNPLSFPSCSSTSLSVKSDNTLGGLGLLCALAEQRIMQETLDDNPSEYNKKDRLIGVFGSASSRKDQNIHLTDSHKAHKIPKPQKEFKNFIAHKMLQYSSLSSKTLPTDVHDMDAAELEMRMRLAELQKKYKEKQKELAKLLPKKEKDSVDKSLAKRGPGRPRKRKLLPLYEPKIGKLRLDDKLKSAIKKDLRLAALHSLINGSPTKKGSLHSGSGNSKLSKMITQSTTKIRDNRPILKPAVLKPQTNLTSTTWLANQKPVVKMTENCPPPTNVSSTSQDTSNSASSSSTFRISFPGGFSFLPCMPVNKGPFAPPSICNTGSKTAFVPPSVSKTEPLPPTVGTKLAPQVNRLLATTGSASTPEDSTTETSDSGKTARNEKVTSKYHFISSRD